MSDYAQARTNMVESQIRPNQIEDPRLLAALGTVPRERFLPRSLWGVAYADEDIPLPSGGHLIEPLALAKLLAAARIRPDDVVLVLGCRTGYAGAVAAHLAATVFLVRHDDAATSTIEGLLDELGLTNVVVLNGEAPLSGLPKQAPFDVVVLTGAVPEIPQTLVEQLGDGGRLAAVVDNGRVGKVTVVTRQQDSVVQQILFDAQIPMLPGAERPPAFVF